METKTGLWPVLDFVTLNNILKWVTFYDYFLALIWRGKISQKRLGILSILFIRV